MRILVVNPNTSTHHTDHIVSVARAASQQDAEIVGMTAPYGAAYIDTRTEAAIAGHATLEMLANAEPCDGAVIAAFVDPGLKAAREAFAFPVVGILESAALTACMLGGRFGIVAGGERALPLFYELVEQYGLGSRFAGAMSTEDFGASVAENPDAPARLAEVADDLIRRNGADVILLGGAPLSVLRSKIQTMVSVPVLDGVTCAVKQLELLIGLHAPKPTAGSYRLPGRRAIKNLARPLSGLFEQ